MSTDYGEKEREFLSTLAADTGRDLAQWMAAITDQNLAGKNEVIDWLRQQGFMFAKASWLERIHDNGGRPIYGTPVAHDTAPAPEVAPLPTARASVPAPTPALEIPAPVRITAAALYPVDPPTSALDLDEPALAALLTKAKALQPLARHLLKEIAITIPGAEFSARPTLVSISAPAEFAVLTVAPRELRLGLALETQPADARFAAAKFPPPGGRVGPHITHMTVLTDARQIDRGLLEIVSLAARGAQQ
ncbi:MAG: DUF5655 domain-containing protein [Hyphomicrobium sp.]